MNTENKMALTKLQPGDVARVVDVSGEGAFRRRLLDMGFVQGAVLRVIKHAPFHNPIEYCIGGTHVTLRHEEASQITVVHLPGARYCTRNGGGRGRGWFRHGRARRLGWGKRGR